MPEQVWIKEVKKALCKQAINKRDLSKIIEPNGAASTQSSWQSRESSQSHLGEQAQSAPGGRSQLRERHDSMETEVMQTTDFQVNLQTLTLVMQVYKVISNRQFIVQNKSLAIA